MKKFHIYCYRWSFEKNPKSITAYVNRGHMYNQYGEYEKAINDCNAGIKLDSNYFKFYINRGISFRKTRQYDLALADYSKAIEKNPQSYETYLDRGILFTDQFNMYEQGIADFRVYLTFRPEDVNGNHNMSVAYYKYRNYDSAMVYCDKAIALALVFHLTMPRCSDGSKMPGFRKSQWVSRDEQLLERQIENPKCPAQVKFRRNP